MRRLASLVLLAATLVVPQVHAQAPVYTFGVPPLAAPRNAALAPGGRLGSRVPPALLAAAWTDSLLTHRRPWYTVPAALAAAETPPPAAPPPTPTGLLGPYADIGMQLNVRFELKADQFRNLRCTAADRQVALSGCSAGFPTITPNPLYAIRTSGVVAQRLHVDVDFDSQREFDANNNLRVWYEGLEDEILRRVEAGNVTFQMPSSRFISAAIPANNFGVQAIAQVGPLELRSIYAQQKGNVVKDRIYHVGQTTSQPIDRDARDLDYEPGRFFFVIDPAALPGYPAVDILSLDQTPRPESLTVAALRVYRRRAVAPGQTGNQNAGGVRAVACGTGPQGQAIDCAGQRAGPFEWEILEERKDYYVDPTGTWFALANRLDQNDHLAVSYITGTRTDTIGTFPVEVNRDTAVTDTLRLVYDPKPGITAAAPSFRFEIRNAYRVGGREVTRESMALALMVNQRERSPAGQPYLSVLGVALDNDPNQFDQYNRLFPRGRDPNQGDPVRDLFIIFPHLTPFADSTKLAPAERNDSLYRTPRGYLATQAPPSVFTLRLHVEASASDDRSVLSLNSFQIREGSERIYVGNILLVRDVNYSIDYTTGQVQFMHVDSLFPAGTSDVRAQFEERAAFSIAPRSIYGLAARYDLGPVGQVNFTGLFQNEQSSFNRPPLGFEPSSSFIGGVSTQLHFQPGWLTRFADFLPGVRTDAPSSLAISGEVAVSKPSPNKFGQAYIEEFEGGATRFITLTDNAWHWGNIPTSTRGAEAYGISASFDPVDAASLTWQSLPYNYRNGQLQPIQFFPQQIDPTIKLAGQTQAAEPVLWFMMKPDTVLGLANNTPASPNFGAPNWVRPPTNGPRWRSITQTLSPTGVDLSRTEFLEFWVWEDGSRVAKQNRALVLLDFGSVFEDALAFVPTSFSVSPTGDTTYSGIRETGLGRLDSERDPRTQTWSATINDEGILSDRVVDGIYDSTRAALIDTLPLCSLTEDGQLIPFVFGDVRSRCGRHNGVVDTEDQDGDFALDSVSGVKTSENFVRYVFPIGDDKYYVRDGGMLPDPNGGAAGWRLYRIPFRTDTLQIGNPNLRQVQALRLTVITPASGISGPAPQVYFALSRVRLVGSTWVKRSDTPIKGIAGLRGTGVGEVVASLVSTENTDLGYTPPPGVVDEAGRRDAGFQLGAVQINERSMRVLARGLGTGERAETYLRFTTEGDKNFLKYQSLRAWARGRGPGWDDGDLEFFIKAGKDQDNFYLYHTPARTISWEPEVRVSFDHWLALRARIEQAWLSGDPPHIYAGCPDSTLVQFDTAYVMCDGPYIVHVKDPGTAPPNLVAVQEIAAGIWRVKTNVFIDQAELWVDDIRLADVVQETGVAGAVDISLNAADVADLAISVSRRDGQFRQLGENPTYLTDNAANIASTVRVDKFLPQTWGLAVPVTFSHTIAASDPFYLTNTDIRADALPGLRRPHATSSTYTFSARRVRRSPRGLGRLVIDPLSISGAFNTGGSRSELAQATGSSYGVNLDWTLIPGARTVRFAGANLRLNPTALSFRSGFAGSDAQRFTFTVPIPRIDDTLPPSLSKTRLWRNVGRVDLVPLGGFQLSVEAASTRDLREYGDSTTMGRLLQQERETFLGKDVGVETQRSLTSSFNLTPRIGAWLRPRFSAISGFNFTRDPNARQPVRTKGDSAGEFRVPAAYNNTRRFDLGAQLDVGRLARATLGDSSGLATWLTRISPVDVSYGRQRGSSYSLATDLPGLGYRLGFGGMDAFRSVDGQLATAAVENTIFTAGSGVAIGFGLRATATYRQTDNVAWTLRSDEQVPLRSHTQDWPSGQIGWTLTPPRQNVGRIIPRIVAQVTYRKSQTMIEQPTFEVGSSVLTHTTDEALNPSVSLTLFGGILLTTDWARSRGDRLAAGSLFHTERDAQNATVTFSFKPPGGGVGRWRSNIRTNAGYTVTANTTCLQSAGGGSCVPYVDSRQAQAQLTMDTDLPSNIGAGLQMAYVLNEERQTNRKVSQFVITAFVQLSTSVGQLK
ncbi:MAG: cell surface protein SprA [Gemmatimonadetes bacterium]|nr:MAG: cell surface protein SprA [Gemmatimonadota bacterium]